MDTRGHILLLVGLHVMLLSHAAQDCGQTMYEEDGKCNFYQCAEDVMPCGNDGYALGFGANFCRGNTSGLTNQAVAWFKDVQRCIMEAVWPHYSDINIGCDDIREIALYAQMDCFTGSDVGGNINKTVTFCSVIANLQNWKTLLRIFKTANYSVKDMPSSTVKAAANDARIAMRQLKDAGSKCVGMGKEVVANITNVFKNTTSILKTLFDPQTIDAVTGNETTNCNALSNTCNCRFYECFERQFPCKRKYGLSHVFDFELTSCREFYKEYDSFNKQGQRWLNKTQICLMKTLVPLLKESSIDCHDLHGLLFKARIQCYVDSGFCNITDDTPNRWAIDRSLQDDNFPVTRSLKPGLDLIASNYYHAEVMLLQRVSGYAHLLCFKDNIEYKLRKLYDRLKTPFGLMNFERIAR